MPGITISYRRDDSGVITGRIFDRLVAHYGRDAIFRDIDDVPLGVDFREHISAVLDASDIVLAIVGPRWIGPRGGQSRLSNEADPVRVEIEAALRKGVPLIPVLVMRGAMPPAAQLPEAIRDFAFRNAIQVDAGQDFDVHIGRLVRAMDRMLEQKRGDIATEALSAAEIAAPLSPPVIEASSPAGATAEPSAFEPAGPAAAMGPPDQARRHRPAALGLALGCALLGIGLGVGAQRYFAAEPPAVAPRSDQQAADSKTKALQDELAAARRQGEQDRKGMSADLAAAQDKANAAQQQLADQAGRLQQAETAATTSKEAERAAASRLEELTAQVKSFGDQLAAEKEGHREALARIESPDGQIKAASTPAAQAPPTTAPSSAGGEANWTADEKREVQKDLRALGYLSGEPDGDFGSPTRAAIKQFQSFAGMAGTGLLTEPQRQALHDRAQRLSALLERPAASPQGVNANTVRGAAQRYARAWNFETGKGVKVDPAEAVYWYGLAASDGDTKALTNLGTLLARGLGVAAPDPAAAALLWETAAARGEATAMFDLGALWENGVGVAADRTRAKAWYERAAAHNHPAARAALQRLGG